MRILPLIVIVACLACHVLARPQEDAEAKPAPARGLLKRGPPNKGKTTTTTTPAPAQDDGEYDEEGDEEGGENVEQPQEASSEAPPSSTEGKKLVGSGVRPFRSNMDLLETLKKKRAQALEARHANPQPAHEDVVSKSSFSKKRFNTATRETKSEEAPAESPAKTGKSRFTRPSSRVNLEVEEEQVEPTPSPRTGRTFARRGN